MTLKENMLEFLKDNGPEIWSVAPRVLDVLDVKIKDCDDEYGAIGEHYVVNCKMILQNVALEKSNEMRKGKPYKATCLVSKKEFDNYRNKRNPIIWL
jgi:hypothetical protein